MADRFFPNPMPDFVPENPKIIQEEEGKAIKIHEQGAQDSLLRLLSLPYSNLSKQLQRTALDLKETVCIYFYFTLFLFQNNLSFCF